MGQPFIVEDSGFNIFRKINTRLFFLLIFAFQVLLIFQGVDLLDDGFLSIFYQKIFSNPVSVSYNFMFWLTGVIGGMWLKAFSSLGLLGLRFAGAIVNTLTLIFTYNLLKNYLKPENLKLGLLIVVLSFNNDIKILYYNTLSGLFYVCIIYFLFFGIRKQNLVFIYIGGFLTGLNVFIRIPNVMELGLIMGFLYYSYLTHNYFQYAFKQILFYLAGFIMAILTALIVMYFFGHLDIFLGTIKLLFSMGIVKTDNPETTGGYGISRLLYIFRSNIIQSLKYSSYAVVFLFGSISLILFLVEKLKIRKTSAQILVFCNMSFILYFVICHNIDQYTILFILTGLLLITSVAIAFSDIASEVKLLAFFGLFFLLSYPLGSSDGIYTAGRYCLWISAPVAVDYLMNLQSLNILLTWRRGGFEQKKKFQLSEKQIVITRNVFLGLIVLSGFYHIYYYPYFDKKNRVTMYYSIESNNLKFIYTSKGRADVVNELLRESSKYLRPNDFVIAYDHIPMFYFASNSTPFMTNPIPYVYSESAFREDLRVSLDRNKVLPVIVRQKIRITGPASKWPENLSPENYDFPVADLGRSRILDSFQNVYGYKAVWSNKIFEILIPTSRR